jgi:hypothetical protein
MADTGGDPPVVIMADTDYAVSGVNCFPDKTPSGTFASECLAQQAQDVSGADDSTVWVMTSVVILIYAAFFSLIMYSCFAKSRASWVNARYIQFDVEAQQSGPKPRGPVDFATNFSPLEAEWRKAFIGKVYTILGMQLFVTFLVSAAMMQFGGAELVRWSHQEGAWAFISSFFAVFGTLIALMCFRHKYPHNFLLLVAFTLSMSFMVGMVCTTYAARGYSALVLEAFAITSIMFIGITAFTMQSKIDFSFLGLGLGVAFLGVFVWLFFAALVFPYFVWRQVYCLVGILLFSLYIVYDTWVISNDLAYDEYILGAINLYLDFINIFLFVLECLTGRSD